MAEPDEQMIEIHLADTSGGVDSIMNIESNRPKDDCQAIVIFYIIIILITIFGMNGPPTLHKEIYHFFPNQSQHFQMDSKIPKTSFYQISLSFEEINPNIPKTMIYRKFKYSITCSKGSQVIKGINSSRIVRYYNHGLSFLLYDTYIRYDQISFSLDLNPSSQYYIVVSNVYGNQAHLEFQFYVRLIFMISSLSFLILFSLSIKKTQSPITFEQKFTLILLLASVICTDPFYSLSTPSRLYTDIHRTLERFYHCFVYFFILCNLDFSQMKNPDHGNRFFIPKIIFFLLQFISLAFVQLSGIGNLFDPSFLKKPGTYYFIFFNVFLSIIYYIWYFILLFKNLHQGDEAIMHKGRCYAMVDTSVLIITCTAPFLGYFKLFSNNSGVFCALHSVLHTFAILMTYFHWPFNLDQIQMYNKPTDKPEGFQSPEEEEAHL